MILRFGRLFTRPMGRWDLTGPFHRLVHRTPDKACFVCRAVWAYLDSLPDFRESVAQGQADLAAGRTRQWRDIR